MGKILWKRAWQPTQVFLPRESHGLSLAGYSPQGCKESDRIEETAHTHVLYPYSVPTGTLLESVIWVEWHWWHYSIAVRPSGQSSLVLWIRGQAEMNAGGQEVSVSSACWSPILINSQTVTESGSISSLKLPGFRMGSGRPASQAPGQDSNGYISVSSSRQS